MKRFLIIIIFLLSINFGYSQLQNEYVTLKIDGKIKKTEHVLSDVIKIVPKGQKVQILEEVSSGVYKVKYQYFVGFMNDVYFSENSIKKKSNNIKTEYENSRLTYDDKPKNNDSYVTLKIDGKIKKTEHVLSDVIKIVPKGQKVQILEEVSSGVYKVKYQYYTGFMNDVYFSDNSSYKKYLSEKKSTNPLPPILTINSVDFSEAVLDGEETASLTIAVKNIGPGDANNVYLNLSGYLQGLSYPSKSYFPTIKANGDVKSITVNIKGEYNLPTSEAILKIEVVEPNFKVIIQGKQLKFPTREFRKPELILAQYAVLENQSANPNNRIDINEMIDLKIAVQNIGQGNAENVEVIIENNQKGVMFLGVVENGQLIRKNPKFKVIQSGKYETVICRYFVNSEFTNEQLKFTIKSNERIGRYGFALNKEFLINSQLEESGYIRNIAQIDDYIQGNVIIEDIPDFVVDVDTDIPVSNTQQTNTYALIIGNEDYKSKQQGLKVEQNVDFAENDAQIFALYCEKTLGIPKKQIKLLKNATAAEINQSLAWLSNLAKVEKGNAKLIFYYSGHGLPHEQTKEAYLIPVDVSGDNIEYAIKVADIYKKLNENSSKQVTVFLDACFSGGARNQSLVSVKGLQIEPVDNLITGNLVVFTSSSGNESSAVYREKKHGYFTYYLLKKLKETNGNVDYYNLSEYIVKSVSKQTGLESKIQTPELKVSYQISEKWKNWKLK